MFRSITRVIALVLLVASPAAADESPQPSEFDSLVAKGGELFQAGKYAEARAAWEKAYAIDPNPRLLFNIGSTYRREGDLDQALRHYRRYLELAPADAPYRAMAEEAILNLEIQIDARTKKAEPEKPAPPPAAPPVERGNGAVYLRWSGIGLGVLGLVSVSVGIFQGLEARDLETRLDSLPAGTEWTRELQDDYDRGQSLETQAIAFSIAGGVAVTVGAVLYVGGILAEPDPAAERAVSIAPYLDGDRAGMAVAGRF